MDGRQTQIFCQLYRLSYFVVRCKYLYSLLWKSIISISHAKHDIFVSIWDWIGFFNMENFCNNFRVNVGSFKIILFRNLIERRNTSICADTLASSSKINPTCQELSLPIKKYIWIISFIYSTQFSNFLPL